MSPKTKTIKKNEAFVTYATETQPARARDAEVALVDVLGGDRAARGSPSVGDVQLALDVLGGERVGRGSPSVDDVQLALDVHGGDRVGRGSPQADAREGQDRRKAPPERTLSLPPGFCRPTGNRWMT